MQNINEKIETYMFEGGIREIKIPKPHTKDTYVTENDCQPDSYNPVNWMTPEYQA